MVGGKKVPPKESQPLIPRVNFCDPCVVCPVAHEGAVQKKIAWG